MKNILKYIMLGVLLSLIILFTGCAEFNIDAKITPDNYVSYSYTLSFTELDEEDANYSQLELFLLDIKEHWEENGVVGRIETSNNSIILTGTMEKQCESREEAFSTLHGFMTNEITVFDSVNLDYNESDYRADYELSFMIDLSGIVDEEIYEVHPAIVDKDVDKFMENFTCKVSFSIPYNEEPQSMEIIENKSETVIPLNTAFSYIIEGTVLDNQAKQYNQDLEKRENSLRTSIIVFSVIAGASLFGIVAIIILTILSRKKANSGNNKEENS